MSEKNGRTPHNPIFDTRDEIPAFVRPPRPSINNHKSEVKSRASFKQESETKNKKGILAVGILAIALVPKTADILSSAMRYEPESTYIHTITTEDEIQPITTEVPNQTINQPFANIPIDSATSTETPPPDEAALPYYHDINEAAKEHGVPQDLLYRLLRQESGFNPEVVSGERRSSAGAQGIAQFMPTTAEGMGINPLNPKQAIAGAALLLSNHFKRFGSWRLALAAYNAGPGNVLDYLNGTNNSHNNPNREITDGVPDFPETQRYVEIILPEE